MPSVHNTILRARATRCPVALRQLVRPSAQPSKRSIPAQLALAAAQPLEPLPTDERARQLASVQGEAARLWASYESLLASHPVRTKALTSMVGLALGDIIAQASTGAFDPMRTARMAAFGAALHGPVGHLWFRLLDAHVMPNDSTAPRAIVTKMVLDQAVFSPVFTAIFYAALTLMEGRPESIVEVVTARLVPTVIAGYSLWPLAHLIGFKYVKREHRLLYINAVNLLWTVHLSKLASAPLACAPDAAAPILQAPSMNPSAAYSGYTAIPVSTSSANLMFDPSLPAADVTVHTA